MMSINNFWVYKVSYVELCGTMNYPIQTIRITWTHKLPNFSSFGKEDYCLVVVRPLQLSGQVHQTTN